MSAVMWPTSPPDPARRQVANNRSTEGAWSSFLSHRARITALIGRYSSPGGRLCVLGAGNCNDLDLEVLADRFREVHLVDLDAGALTRGVFRQGCTTWPRVVTHAPVDLTGVLDRLPGLAATTPDRLDSLIADLEVCPSVLGAQRFDLVISTGLLTQIFSSVVDLGLDHTSLARLIVALRRQHLHLMSRLAAPNGACVLVTELVSSTTVPELATMRPEELHHCVAGLLTRRNFFTGTHPSGVVRDVMHGCASCSSLAWAEPISPWLWHLSHTRSYLAYAVVWGMRPRARDRCRAPRRRRARDDRRLYLDWSL